ncbi:SDR family NAD(P)-dependent oxidoreductase [Porphyrobacter sp. GA68]|uniref:SDR family NAD(P)-dependent oxidoreductase n=1 Tax=Porphyrobacter sp. GA68 TaxID=2883480 RepID=UPI001D18EA87|nr:SDR family NAD(P)-dependent oxidoreductase [Porphyrobacter sp. GA68]
MAQTAMIIGASRGIGLGLVRELAARGWRVIASERSHSAGLHDVARERPGQVEIVTADVTDRVQIDALRAAGTPKSLDVLLVNAGIWDAQPVDEASDADLLRIMRVNAAGPIGTARILLPLVRDGGILAFTTSRMGSIADSSGGSELYRMSKAAQNMLARGVFVQTAKPRGIPVLSLHPGWVRTEMGGDNAPVGVAESAHGLADVLSKAHPLDHHFLDYTGAELPW